MEINLSTNIYNNSNKNTEKVLLNNIDIQASTNTLNDSQSKLTQIKDNLDSISMSDLMKLLNEIIESSKKLRSQVLNNRIGEATATTALAQGLAVNKKDTAQTKFAINLAAGVTSMALTTASTFKAAKSKPVQDKHLTKLGMGDNAKASSLSASQRNDMSASLQQQRTAKYNSIGQLSNSSKEIVGTANEIQNADNIEQQEKAQATKDQKQRLDEQLNPYIESLTKELTTLLEIMSSIQSTASVTNR